MGEQYFDFFSYNVLVRFNIFFVSIFNSRKQLIRDKNLTALESVSFLKKLFFLSDRLKKICQNFP